MNILNNFCTIQLSNGMITLVDQEDWLVLRQYNWTISFNNYSYYAKRNARIGKRSESKFATYIMHRVIMGAKGSQQVDHRNGDTLDNRKSNLRIATQSQNKKNRRRISSNSGFKGVHRVGDKWYAYITYNKSRSNIGIFNSGEEAARAYDRAAKRLHGEFACTNADLKAY